jgi:cytochrome c oxidase cbb3-type subunit IV
MFEAIKHNMETIDGVAIYPIVSLLIFFLFFLGLGIWVFTYKKETITAFSHMPLTENHNDEPLIQKK